MTENNVEFINMTAASDAYTGALAENVSLRNDISAHKEEIERITQIAQHYQRLLATAHTKLAAMKLILGSTVEEAS